jgi:uncharacterized membrane protein
MTPSDRDIPARTKRAVVADTVPAIRSVAFDAPWHWLALGWQDVWAMPGISLSYGAFVAVAAAVIGLGLWAYDMQALFLALAGGFLLIAPLIAVGLYAASRDRASGRTPALNDALTASLATPGQLLFLGAMLLILFLLWVRAAFLLLMLFFGQHAIPPANAFMSTLLFTAHGLGMLIVGTIIGGILATVAFSTTAIAVPMLLDRRVDAVSAALCSIQAVTKNPKAMALWAALIAALTAVGFATLLVGLVIVFPLIGHATWHAYQDLTGSPTH